MVFNLALIIACHDLITLCVGLILPLSSTGP